MIATSTILVVSSYILITFFMGLYWGKGTTTMRDYTTANKRYNSAVLAMTFVATSFGAGSMVGDAAKVAMDGIIFTVAMSGAIISLFLIRKFATKYIDERFEDMMSPGDIMQHFYGRKAEFITGIIGFMVSSLTVGGQLTALGNILSNFLGVDYRTMVVIAGLVVVAYVTSGGIKSVTVTDIFQFLIILITIPTITIWLVNKAGGLSTIIKAADPVKLSLAHSPKKIQYALLFICSIMPFMWMQPPAIQRYLMAKSGKSLGKVYKLEISLRILFSVFLIPFLAFSTLHLFPESDPKHLISNLIKTALPPGLKDAFLVAILAATMSTADSHLNASSILFTKNFLYIGRKVSDKDFLRSTRISTVLVGICAITIGLKNADITELVVTTFSMWGSIIMVPMIAAILKLPHSRSSFYISATLSIVAFLTAKILKLSGFMPGNLAVLASIISFSLSEIYKLAKKKWPLFD